MKLYYSPGACSLAVHILLAELGKKYEVEKVDLASKKTAAGKDFLKINPKGYVPALDIGKGQMLTEVQVILQYLADKAKATKLLPKAGTMARYHAMESLNFVSAELHKGFGPLFNRAMPEDGKAAAKERLAQRFGHLDAMLGKANHVSGKNFGVADAYAYTVLRWAPPTGFDMKQWPHIQKYMERVGARPAVQKALAEEGLK